MRIHWNPARAFGRGRAGAAPRAIVLHTTAGTLASSVAWFRDERSGVSAHYVVGRDGRIVQMVAEPDTAFHAGRADRLDPIDGRDPNRSTIGIEIVDDGDAESAVRSEQQRRSVSTLVAEAARRWGIPLDRRHVLGHRELDTKKRCPGNVDVDDIVDEAGRRAEGLARPTICLSPIRNAATQVRQFLDSVGGICDGVVALDDGSTDETAELLAASPLVRVLLQNPVRASAAGWDDGRNRARLLEAAATLDPGWILSLDADERIAPDDAVAMRNFLSGDALRGCAYGLEHYRMWGAQQYDPSCHLVYRLFAYRPGQSFPDERLHFNPVPTDIPRQAWIPTSLRMQHFGAHDDATRRDRLEKYRQADPDGHYPVDFGGLDSEPGELRTWGPRGERDVLRG